MVGENCTNFVIVGTATVEVSGSSFNNIAWVINNHIAANMVGDDVMVNVVIGEGSEALRAFVEELCEENCYSLSKVPDVNEYIQSSDRKLKSREIYSGNRQTSILAIVNKVAEIEDCLSTITQIKNRPVTIFVLSKT